MTRLVLALGVATLVAAIPAGAATTARGFGNGGWVRVGGGYDSVAAIAVRADGRIVVLTSDGFLQQRLADGRLDRSFRGGHVDDSCGCAVAHLALQPDGQLLVAYGATIARFAKSGRRDTQFRVSLGSDAVSDLATLPDGRIVVATADGRLRRFLRDGVTDSGFGTVLPSGGPRIAVQPDGALVVSDGPSGLARYLPDGSRDGTFAAAAGLDGVDLSAVAVQPDGRILAAGVRIVNGQGPQTEVWRLLPSGAPDVSFGNDGVATFRYQFTVATPTAALALPDASVALVGSVYPTCPCKGAGWLATRVAPDGTAEAFPVPGDADPEHDCWGGTAGAVAVDPDGRILVGGDMCDHGGSSAFVGRLLPSLALDAGPTFTATLSRVRMRGGRVSATLVVDDAADITAVVRRVHGFDAPLLPGSVLGTSTTIRSRMLHASVGRAGQIPLVLRFAPRRGARYVVQVQADDGRDGLVQIRLPLR